MKIEFCIESIEGAIAAEKWNANRIEICKDLNNDGLTPDMDFIDKCTSKFNGESFIMIRPKRNLFAIQKKKLFK